MVKKIFFFLILFLGFLSHGQKQGDNWFFGNGAGISFANGNPVPVNTGQTSFTGCPACHAEGTAVMSDSSGALLFYTDGNKIWNKNHQLMPNGTNLFSNISSTQSSLIVAKPGSDSLFYVFNVGSFFQSTTDTLAFGYSVVNMCLNGGLGDVIPGQKNVILDNVVTEKLTGIRHTNGVDYWILQHKFNSNAFHAYLFNSNGISTTPVVSNVGSVHTGQIGTSIGQLKASPNGQKLALVNANTSQGIAEYFDLDPSTGIVSNPVSIQTNPNWNHYGVSFSPDNSKLYLACILNGNGIYQFDLSAGGGSPTAVMASKTQIAFTYNYMGLQLANNGKIYVARSPFSSNTYLGVIDNPNLPGTSCNFIDSAVNLNGNVVSFGLPNFIDSYDYSNGIPTCICDTSYDTTSVSSCVNYTWSNGITYANSGLYSQTVTSAVGCDSVLTLNLTIIQPSASSVSIVQCDSFTWTNGITYTNSGTYSQTLTNAEGCDSTSSLNLTILQPSSSSLNVSQCDNFTWTNGITYTISGTYSQTLISSAGCDSTLTLNLTIVQPTVYNINLTQCDSFTWTNGITYTNSGTYSQNLTNSTGCDSTLTLSLTIVSSSISVTNISNCGSYIWTNGVSYTNSGTYTQTLTNASGCDSTAILNLTVYDKPIADFNSLDEPLIGESAVLFENNSQNFTQSVWFVDDIPFGNQTNLIYNHSSSENWDFTVQLIVSNDFCFDSISKTIILDKDQLIYVPNAFSPNDDEHNSLFLPIISEGLDLQDYSLTIYNRWGEVIFISQNTNFGWDGTYLNSPVPPGAYVWKISIENATSDEREELNGHVLLLR